MKTLRKIGFAVMAVIACVGITSCSDDDDDNGGGSGNITATADGASIGLKYAYWWIDTESTTTQGDKTMHIEFWSFDANNMASFPGSMSLMTIDYEIPSSVNEIQTTTLESGDYHIYLVQNMTPESDGYQAETQWNATNNSDCVIVRDGNNVSITIDNAKVYDENSSKTVVLKFNGNIAKAPASITE